MVDGGNEIGGRRWRFGGIGADLVALAVDFARLDAGAGEQHGVDIGPMFATGVLQRDFRRTAELAGDDDQRFVEFARLFQVGHQGIERAIKGRNQIVLEGGEVVPVRVPSKTIRALRPLPVALHQSRARLQQAAAEEHRLAEQIPAVAFPVSSFGLRKIDRFANRITADNIERASLIGPQGLSLSAVVERFDLRVELIDELQPSTSNFSGQVRREGNLF